MVQNSNYEFLTVSIEYSISGEVGGRLRVKLGGIKFGDGRVNFANLCCMKASFKL